MNWTENSLLLEHPFIARIPNAFPPPLKWPQFQDALLRALGQKALCILISFIFNQDQNILPNLLQAAFGYNASILLYLYWFGSFPHCHLFNLIVNIANTPYNNCWNHSIKTRSISLCFQLLFSRCTIMHFPTIAYCSHWKYCVCSAFFTWLSTSRCPTCLSLQWKGFFTWLLGKKGHESIGERNLLLWFNEFDNESDTASSLDLAVWSIITMAHHFPLWIVTFLPPGEEERS